MADAEIAVQVVNALDERDFRLPPLFCERPASENSRNNCVLEVGASAPTLTLPLCGALAPETSGFMPFRK